MHEVFVNYRTGDGDAAAALVKRALSERFGDDAVFHASKSIKPGIAFAPALLDAAGACKALLAIIGEGWLLDERLNDPQDWVRREIIAALDSRAYVIPVLVGRTLPRLDRAAMPEGLGQLAEVQSLRLDMRDNGMYLDRIGDALAEYLPEELGATDRKAAAGETNNRIEGTVGTAFQIGHSSGDIGTVIKGSQGPVHTGSGSNNTFNGGNQGGIHFGGSRARDREE